MKRISSLLIGLSALLFAACGSNEIGKVKDVNPQSIYFDYKLWGEEGNDDMTVMLQYRFAGANGTTLVLDDPSKVELDGVVIPGDSSKMTGAFYEVMKPIKQFTGKHEIVFTDFNKKQYKESFDFEPIELRTRIPDLVRRDDLVFELSGLDPVDYVRVLLTDTSFESDGINRVQEVRNGRVMISKKELEAVFNGPVHLELYKENDKPIKDRTEEGGKLSITYGLKRDFTLKSAL